MQPPLLTAWERFFWASEWSKALDTGGLVVGNEVGIQVDVEWVRK